MSILVVDCSNCHTPLNLPPRAKSIRCALCHAVTPISDSGGSSFPTSNSGDHIHPYNNHAPMSVSGMSLFPGLAMDVTSPSPYNHAPAGSPPSVHGRKKAVIVGVSYKLTRYELKGCINDAKYMKHLLISRFQFPEASIIMLTEEETESTIRNIRNALNWLIQGCEPGDSLVFHYSGHGSWQRNLNGDEIDVLVNTYGRIIVLNQEYGRVAMEEKSFRLADVMMIKNRLIHRLVSKKQMKLLKIDRNFR